MNKISKAISCFFYGISPIYKKCVLFSSFYGQYNDNPKYVSERLHEVAPDVEIVWVKSSKCREPFPDYVKTVEFGSKEYYRYVYRAQVIVENHMGIRSKTVPAKGKMAKLSAKRFAKKRKGQMNISTWHGTPLKKIALDEPGKKENFLFYTNTDYAVAGYALTRDAFHSGFSKDIPVKMYGSPRNDILFGDKVDVDQLKEKLGLPKDKRILLFAPTFRNSVEDSGVTQMQSLEYSKIFAALREKFGGEWCFVFRVHNNVLLKIDVEDVVQKCEGNLYAGNVGDDMAEYIVCADAMITDYSGCMVDYALTGKPCFLYAHDLEHYRSVERGFYLDIQDWLAPIAQTSEELVAQIRGFEEEKYRADVAAFLEKIGNVEQGVASEKIVEDVIAFIQGAKKEQ